MFEMKMKMKGNQFVGKQMETQTTRIFIFKLQKYLNLGLQSKQRGKKFSGKVMENIGKTPGSYVVNSITLLLILLITFSVLPLDTATFKPFTRLLSKTNETLTDDLFHHWSLLQKHFHVRSSLVYWS